MLVFCRHNYQYTQGYFVCVKCRKIKRQSSTRWGRRRKKRVGIILGVIVVAVLGILLFYPSSHPTYVTIPIPALPTQFSAPLRSVEPQIIKTISNLSNSISQNPAIQAPTTPQPDVTTPISKPTISISELEQKIHVGINLQRQNQGLNPLVYDNKIAEIAREHSQDMASRNYFEHDTPEGVSPAQRGINAGYSSCGDRQAIADSQEYDTLSKQFQATGNTDQNLYNQLQALYPKVNSEINNGMIFEGFAENIEQNNLYDSIEYIDGVPYYHWLNQDQLADSVVQTWMGSEGHRHNILTPVFYSEGIGVAITNDDKVYITEDFC